MSKRDNIPCECRVHRAVRNILFNEIGITPAKLEEIVNNRIDKIIGDKLAYGMFDKMVQRAIMEVMKRPGWSSGNFVSWVREEIRQQIINTVTSNLFINLRVEPTPGPSQFANEPRANVVRG